MESCPMSMSVRFPAIPLRFGQIPKSSSFHRTSTSPFRSYASCSNLLNDTVTVKSESGNRMFILGLGFVGEFFAQALKNQGWVVSGTCTSIAKKKKLEEMGFNVHVFYANEPGHEVLNVLNYHTHLLVSIPPAVGIGDPMLQHGELLKSRLMDGDLRWLCYLSSTSVYGNCGGAWVDEDYPISPTSESAKARLAAEEGWLNLGHDLGLAAQIFRLGGIYGPGRSAIDTIFKRDPLSEDQRMRSYRQYTSRVHVADICQALNASIHSPTPGKIYNIVDDDPCPRAEVFTFARNLIEKKWPSQIKQVTSLDRSESFIPKWSSRGEKRVIKQVTSLDRSESFIPKWSSRGEKRVSNARMKKELGVRLLHPNYRSGLQSIIEHLDNPSLYDL